MKLFQKITCSLLALSMTLSAALVLLISQNCHADDLAFSFGDTKNSNITLTSAKDIEFSSFKVNNPYRLVVDIKNVSLSPVEHLSKNAQVPKIQVNKLGSGSRIVLEPVPGMQLMTRQDSPRSISVLVIQTAQELGVVVPPVSLTSLKATGGGASPENSIIERIEFQVIDGISRVSIKMNRDISVEAPTKASGFVTLTIRNSTLPKNLQNSLETLNSVSPVLRITPFSVKVKNGIDTIIKITTRITAPFYFHKEGDMIYIDFKHPEGMDGDKLFIKTTDKNVPAHLKSDLVPVEEKIPYLPSNSDSVVKSSGTAKGYTSRKITLEFADADVRKIFQLLAEVSNKNFVLSDEVTGVISLKLVNVPWRQALDIVLDTKDLDSRETGNVLTIKKKGKFITQESIDSEIKKSIEKNIPLQPAKVFSVNYATLGDVVLQFEKISSGPKGSGIRTDASVLSDSRTNKIIVVDTLNNLKSMQNLLTEIDQPEKQVMIEARIIEATSTFSRNLGVSWGIHHRDGSAAFMNINSMDTSFGGLTSAPPTTGIAAASGGNMGISFGTLASNIKVDARLNAAASTGLIKIISSPKVATLNHKPAKISQGQQIPYQNTTATTGAVTAFVAATLSLEVTPHINANGTIIMKIDAKNDAPGTGSPPPINTKQATTEMLLRDGETTVIGGIFVDNDVESSDGVPFLMDIPYLGNLFKSSIKIKTQTELIIFITPRILDSV